jgi:NAD-dependent deacetylase
MQCGKEYSVYDIMKAEGVPHCDCGGLVKPDVVLYGEGLDDLVLVGAIGAISDADLLIVAGTSLSVYPASGLIRYFKGDNLVIINKTPTMYDKVAECVISGNIGEVLSKIKVK